MAMAGAVLGMLVAIAVVPGMVMVGGLRHEPCRYEARVSPSVSRVRAPGSLVYEVRGK